jgi:hypothetical protein
MRSNTACPSREGGRRAPHFGSTISAFRDRRYSLPEIGQSLAEIGHSPFAVLRQATCSSTNPYKKQGNRFSAGRLDWQRACTPTSLKLLVVPEARV